MKKHQLAAMLLSALSAGVLMSCAKTEEEQVDNTVVEPVDSTSNTEQDGSNTTTPTASRPTAIDLSDDTALAYLEHVAKDSISTTYQTAAAQSNQLSQLAQSTCQTAPVTGERLAALREQWLSVATAWAAAEKVNFGPATVSMSDLYINYYPDTRGLVHQGVVDLINNNPNLTPEQLAQESAIVQGLPGLEEVLYANDTLDINQCRYVTSASAALAQHLADISGAWQQTPDELLGITVNTAQNRGEHEAATLGMNRWINSLLALVEVTKGDALDKPLGLTGSKKGHLPAAAAKQSRAILNAKVATLSNALSDPMLLEILNTHGHDVLADDMSTVLADAAAILAQMPENINDAEPTQQHALYDKLTELTRIIKNQLMPVMGVQVGFNDTDGD